MSMQKYTLYFYATDGLVKIRQFKSDTEAHKYCIKHFSRSNAAKDDYCISNNENSDTFPIVKFL